MYKQPIVKLNSCAHNMLPHTHIHTHTHTQQWKPHPRQHPQLHVGVATGDKEDQATTGITIGITFHLHVCVTVCMCRNTCKVHVCLLVLSIMCAHVSSYATHCTTNTRVERTGRLARQEMRNKERLVLTLRQFSVHGISSKLSENCPILDTHTHTHTHSHQLYVMYAVVVILEVNNPRPPLVNMCGWSTVTLTLP